jgi:hypothetical protein
VTTGAIVSQYFVHFTVWTLLLKIVFVIQGVYENQYQGCIIFLPVFDQEL